MTPEGRQPLPLTRFALIGLRGYLPSLIYTGDAGFPPARFAGKMPASPVIFHTCVLFACFVTAPLLKLVSRVIRRLIQQSRASQYPKKLLA